MHLIIFAILETWELKLPYRNKTFVSFASEDILMYRLMRAWKKNKHIEFDFHDAHDLNIARDSSKPETIKRRLRVRLQNTKQVVVLASSNARKAAADPSRFIHYEIGVIRELKLPVVIANISGSRIVQKGGIPAQLLSDYTISTSLQAAAIKYALDEFPVSFRTNRIIPTKTGPHQYAPSVYTALGL